MDITFLFFRPAVLDQIMHGSHAPWKVLESSGVFYPFKGVESSGNQCMFWKVVEI